MRSKRTVKNTKKPKGPARSARERVRTFLKLFGGQDSVLITINADPDAMASALAVKRLLWKHAHRTQIAYINEIQRLDNLAMMELLKIPMEKMSKVSVKDFTHKVLVDSQPSHSEIFETLRYDAIIDHHPIVKKWNAPYVDIRPEYGANSTILIEYLREAGIKPSRPLATGLLYGIKTDTANFERGGNEKDVRQFQYIFPYVNMNVLRKIERSELRDTDLRYFETALANRIVTKRGIYSHLGKVPSGDICVQVADFFNRVHGMGWTFVSGVYEGNVIVIIRNDGYRKDAGKLVGRAFGHLGLAGGHSGAARAEIPLETLRQMGIKGYGTALGRFIRGRLKF
ncbi:MAG: DHH family phosphoesterase [Deltaproteobacteria bacterium]|nr:MAG: DHH family phosphoesterase [Deltaproteobacteria bacterium]